MTHVRNPFDTLPEELLAKTLIFSRKYEEFQDSYGLVRHLLPARLMLVCRYWYRVIRDTADFWIDVRITTQTTAECIAAHIDRSGIMPLFFWLELGAVANREALETIHTHRQRCEGLLVENRPLTQGAAIYEPVKILNEADIDIAPWITMAAPSARLLHIGGLSVHPKDGEIINLSSPRLETLSYGSTVPRFRFQDAPNVRALRLHSCWIALSVFVQVIVTARESLRSVHIDDGSVGDGASRNRAWQTCDMPALEEVSIQVGGYDGFAKDLFSNINCPLLKSLSYACRGDAWDGPGHIDISWPCLEVLNLDEGHPVPAAILSDILVGSPNIQKLYLPRLRSEILVEGVADAIGAYGASGARVLRELRSYDFSAAQLRAIVEAIPSISRLDLSNAHWELYEKPSAADDVRWLKENVGTIEGYWWNN